VAAAFQSGAFQQSAFQSAVPQDPGRASGRRYPLRPWKKPRSFAKADIEAKRQKVEEQIREYQSDLNSVRGDLRIANLSSVIARAEKAIAILLKNIAELERIKRELDDEEMQLMALIATLH